MSKGAVLFGATILVRGIEPNGAARSLLRLYNAKGVFNNLGDDFEASQRRSQAALRSRGNRDERMRSAVPGALI
jgi:hypothetical protein